MDILAASPEGTPTLRSMLSHFFVQVCGSRGPQIQFNFAFLPCISDSPLQTLSFLLPLHGLLTFGPQDFEVP